MDLLKYLGSVHQSYLWANLIWGTVAGGYMIYGWKQKMLIPFVGGLVMTAISFFLASAIIMTLASIAIMYAVWWLVKEGY